MDILLTADNDLYINPKGDITLKNSVAQKIRIKLLWFEGEWRWDEEKGLPYFSELLIKNPDIDGFAELIREEIFAVDEVVEVRDVTIEYDKTTRKAKIKYIALTDLETIKEEVDIKCQVMV